jgi:hypothetical protein
MMRIALDREHGHVSDGRLGKASAVVREVGLGWRGRCRWRRHWPGGRAESDPRRTPPQQPLNHRADLPGRIPASLWLRQSAIMPPVRLAIAPVIALPPSEATKAATSAISATVGNCLRIVRSAMRAANASWLMP